MRFFLFVLLNAVLFLRPQELMPSLQTIQFYNWTILACLAVTFPAIFAQLSPSVLAKRPINVCVLGVFFAAIFSHLTNMSGDGIWYARYTFETFGKIILYFLLAIAVLDRMEKVDRFFVCLLGLIAFVAGLALAHHHGLIHLPALEALDRRVGDVDGGEFVIVQQLRGTGIFNDPNDLAMILVVGVVIALHIVTDRSQSPLRVVALAPLALLVYAIFMTKSRGGALAFFAALAVLSHSRWGWKRTILMGALALPIVVVIFKARGGSDGDDRFELWSQGIQLIKQAPVFGIGWGQYGEEAGHVAHNSFLHCYSELGLVGGTLFLGAFLAAILALFRMRSLKSCPLVTKTRLTTALAAVCGIGVSMLTLSRSYAIVTYLVLALASSVIVIESRRFSFAPWELPRLPRWNLQFLTRSFTSGLAFLFLTYVLVLLGVR